MAEGDKEKIARFRELFSEQLTEYGFSSLPVSSVSLSPDSYRPSSLEGMDLQFDLSASDLIRSIWAYRLSFLELARDKETNHLGLLVIDQPGQQEMASESFSALLQRASRAGAYGQQILLATSEEQSVVQHGVVA